MAPPSICRKISVVEDSDSDLEELFGSLAQSGLPPHLGLGSSRRRRLGKTTPHHRPGDHSQTLHGPLTPHPAGT